MSSALPALARVLPQYPISYGTRAQLAAAGGEVEGCLAFAGSDRRAGTANYALRIVNQTSNALRARMSCARLRGEPVRAYPLDIRIAPFAVSETLLPVRLADVGPYDRAIVEVYGEDVAFSLEAPAPARRRQRSKLAAAASAAALLTFGAAFGAAAATPRIGVLAAPAHAFAGSRIDVPYAFSGWAFMRYALRTSDGRQLSAGLTNAHDGTLHFSVPAAAGKHVVVDAVVSGPFGTRSAHEAVAIAAPPVKRPQAAAAPVRIDEFSVVTPVVRAGEPMQLSYATNAHAGEIWLIDQSGRLLARAAMNPSGTATLRVPQSAAGLQARAVLHARTGTQSVLASVGVTVLPGALVTSNSAPQAAASTAPPALSLSSANAAPGDTIVAALSGAHGDAQISLTDASGNVVEQADVPAGEREATFSAPTVTAAQTYYVTAQISDGAGEQTLVKPLRVTPR